MIIHLAYVFFEGEMFQTQVSLFMGFLEHIHLDAPLLIELFWTSERPDAGRVRLKPDGTR